MVVINTDHANGSHRLQGADVAVVIADALSARTYSWNRCAVSGRECTRSLHVFDLNYRMCRKMRGGVNSRDDCF